MRREVERKILLLGKIFIMVRGWSSVEFLEYNISWYMDVPPMAYWDGLYTGQWSNAAKATV